MLKALTAVLLLSPALMAQDRTIAVQGTVSDAANKKPVAGAFVTASRTALPPASQWAKTASDGTFEIAGLPAGEYSLCTQVQNSDYLDPCQWSHTATKVTLTAGQKSAAVALKLERGSTLSIRIDDPGQVANKKTRDGRDPHILMGVMGQNGLFYPARLASKDAAGANFQLTVPRDTSLRLNVASRDLKLAGANGAQIAASGDVQRFQHGTGDPNPKSFRYTVTGIVP